MVSLLKVQKVRANINLTFLKVVVRFESKVIVSEPQRDEPNYEPFDALSGSSSEIACSG
jgi:hypothetical protein